MSAVAIAEAGARLLVKLEKDGNLTPTQLKLVDSEMPFERWEALGLFLGRVSRSSRWWIGDWLNFGEAVYGEKYAAAAEETGLEPGTLIHYSYVARQVPPSRRKEQLPFSSHALVAPLEPKEQREWLNKAVKEGWTRAEFRDALRDAGMIGRGGAEPTPNGGGGDDGVEPLPDQIVRAARYLLNTARKNGGDYIVTSEAIARLRAAIGEED